MQPTRDGRPNIMVVDEEPDITGPIAAGLQMHGFDVDSYNDPVEAISNFRSGKYDLVLLDINMPRMNGFHVYRELKKADKNVRICFFTSFDLYESEFRKIFPEVKVQRFLKKPLSIATLTEEVNRLLVAQ